jgi:molecular chaperone DnaK (HSP70)
LEPAVFGFASSLKPRDSQSGTKAVLAGSAYLTGVWQMTMETQVVSMEDDEAYTVQFFDDAGTAVSVYFQNPQHVHLSTADAVNEATARMLRLLEPPVRKSS